MKRLPTRPLVLGASALFAAACATIFGFGPTRDKVRIPHERHIKADVECLTCHETIFDSTDVMETQDLPKEKVCFGCHKKAEENKDCAFCHSQPQAPQTFVKRERHMHFDHSKHLELEAINENCRTCHKALYEPEMDEPPRPPMETCLGCHEHEQQYEEGRCEVCHTDLSIYPLKPVSTFSHQGDWLHLHPAQARSRGTACFTCHDQSFCTDCHAKTVALPIEQKLPERWDRLMIHRGNWEGRHMIDAQAEPQMCLRCHSTSYCETCHTRRGLTPAGGRSLNPHGPGLNDPNSPDFHGKQARQDIVACAACHDQGAASNCVRCHKVGGVGGNPHPASWLLRHRQEETEQNAMCLTCHR